MITDDADTILNAERIILPGVGAFGNAMAQRKNRTGSLIREAVRRKIPFLGICLGLQLLFEKSDEALGVKGLGVFKRGSEEDSGKKRIRFLIWDGILCILRIMESCSRESKGAHMFILCTSVNYYSKKRQMPAINVASGGRGASMLCQWC